MDERRSAEVQHTVLGRQIEQGSLRLTIHSRRAFHQQPVARRRIQ